MHGNVTVEQATHNALLLLEMAGRVDIPVAQGAAGPLKSLLKPLQTFDFVHGVDGLGNTHFPSPTTKAHSLDAARVSGDREKNAFGVPLLQKFHKNLSDSGSLPHMVHIVLLYDSTTRIVLD